MRKFFALTPKMSLLAIAIVVVSAGTVWAINTYTGSETETATRTSNAGLVSDATASGGAAVKFSVSAAFAPGNPDGNYTVPPSGALEDVSSPDRVVGTGTSSSCTSAAVIAAVTAGGVVTFNCGPDPVTITLDTTAKVRNSTTKLVLDGGGKVTLSGGGARRILYVNTCDTSQGTVSGNCLYAPTKPQVTLQNITLADGNSSDSTDNGPWADSGGGAIMQLGGRLKVVRSGVLRNTCTTNGPDLGGAAIRVLAQHSDTPNNLDNSQAAFGQYPVMIVQSTFGGASGQGGNCSNGGAISGLRTPISVYNSLITYNNAIGCCANPAWSGTPGGGSGGAIYSDGTSYDVNIYGTLIEHNTAKAGGSSIFYVSNDNTGHLTLTDSISRNNTYAPNGQSGNPHFENYPGIFYLGDGPPTFTNSTVQ